MGSWKGSMSGGRRGPWAEPPWTGPDTGVAGVVVWGVVCWAAARPEAAKTAPNPRLVKLFDIHTSLRGKDETISAFLVNAYIICHRETERSYFRVFCSANVGVGSSGAVS